MASSLEIFSIKFETKISIRLFAWSGALSYILICLTVDNIALRFQKTFAPTDAMNLTSLIYVLIQIFCCLILEALRISRSGFLKKRPQNMKLAIFFDTQLFIKNMNNMGPLTRF